MTAKPGPPAPTIRLDKLLWYLRFAGSRALAQQWVLAGHIRINGQRASKPAAALGIGDILTLPLRSRVMVIELVQLPHRRGPAAEAQACYRDRSAPSASDSQQPAVP